MRPLPPRRPDPDRCHVRAAAVGDRGDIVVGWLARVVVLLALAGVVGFDALSIGSSRLAVQDQAGVAARAAAEAFAERRDVQAAYGAAVEAAGAANPGNQVPPAGFHVAADGSVSLTVARRADTVLVHRLGPIASWARVGAAVTRDAPV